MAQIINCENNNEPCDCGCNCQAFLANGRHITVNPLEIDNSQYTFSYTVTNEDPKISFILFCIQCPSSKFTVSEANTSINVIGNPASATPIIFNQCFTTGCESEGLNRFFVEFGFEDENKCCFFQGIKIDLNPDDTITEIQFDLIFTLAEEVIFSFQPGSLKLKNGENTEIVNNLCLPGCLNGCQQCKIICEMWKIENEILKSKKNVFVHFSQLILPAGLDLNTLTIEELENKIRTISRLEKCTAELDCDIAKVLKVLNEFKICNCCH